MKKMLLGLTASLLVLSLMVFPAPSEGAIGDVGTGADLNGVYYQREWLDGNWSEFYSIDGSYWGVWIEMGTAETPGSETGDYYRYANLVDGETTAYNWYSTIDSVIKEEEWLRNAATGYYMLEYDYNALALSDPLLSYRETISTLQDPLSGVSENSYFRGVDFDDDGDYWGDWFYSTWDSYYAGTGEGYTGTELRNWIDGIREYDTYLYNSYTGWYSLANEYYLDTDLDGNWSDNYYTQYYEGYDASNGYFYSDQYIRDYDAVVYSAATYYTREYSANLFTGEYYEYIDARTDTDGDGSWNDYGYLGPNPGAYRYEYTDYFEADTGYTSSRTTIWDALSNVYTVNYYWEYLGTGYAESGFDYRWDADKDGSYTDDYYYNGYSRTNYYGRNYSGFVSYDYLTDLTGDGIPNPAYYNYYYEAQPTNDYLYTYTMYQYDTDGDGSWGDYNSGGAYYSYYREENDPSDGKYELEYFTYTPPSADYSTLFSYDYYYYEREGDYWYEETQRAVDADFDNNLWDYSWGDFGGAYYTYTSSKYDPSYYGEFTTYTETWDPWANYYRYDYYETYEDAARPGEPFYTYAYTDLYLDTDDDNDIQNNYRAYFETYADQYSGDGYNYTYYYYYDYDNGIYEYDYAESYASGHAYTQYQYAKDTDGDGNIETWSGDDFWYSRWTEFNASDNSYETYAWISDDYNNNRGAFWWSEETSYENMDSGDNWTIAASANLAGWVFASSGTHSGGNESALWSELDNFYWDGLAGQRGQTWDLTSSATWGDSLAGSGSYSYAGGDSGTWTRTAWDTDGDTSYYNINAFYPGFPEWLSWDIRSETWSRTEGAWQYAGYILDDGDTGNYFFNEEGKSANFDFKEWATRDGATGNYNEVSFIYASGAAAPSFGSSEWWYGTGGPYGTPYDYYLYSGAAGAWYLYYADPYPSI